MGSTESIFTIKRKIRKDGTYAKSQEGSNYCSRSCANSHIFTEEQNKSKGRKGHIQWNKGLSKYKNKFCKICGKKIYSNNVNGTGYCLLCFNKSKTRKNRASKNLLKQYKNGREIYGGITKWYNYKNIKVQGTYELRTCFILDKMLELGEINNWEYTNNRIKYIGEDNKEHSYLLDFKVDDYYIETKGYIQKKDLLKWKAAENQGIKLKKWFLEDIKKEEKRLNMVGLAQLAEHPDVTRKVQSSNL